MKISYHIEIDGGGHGSEPVKQSDIFHIEIPSDEEMSKIMKNFVKSYIELIINDMNFLIYVDILVTSIKVNFETIYTQFGRYDYVGNRLWIDRKTLEEHLIKYEK